jgi:hypothetical protein
MNGNRITQAAADQKLVDGFNRHGSLIGSLLIDGKQHKPADVVQVVQGRLDASKAVETDKATWQSAVKANKDQRAKTRVFITQVRQALLVMFASSIDILADFGLTPRKQRAPTPPVKVAAAEKAKATRVARGTKGKKQKAKIKGAAPQATPATPPTPATAPAVPTPTTQPKP